MSRRHAVSIAVAGLAALSLSTSALAFQGRGGHSSGSHISGGVRHFEGGHFPGPRHFHSGPRVFIGGSFYAPFYYPPYYYDPYYYAPPPPVEYVQPAPQQYWYYCGSARAYYPYVQNCPEGWQQVLPQP